MTGNNVGAVCRVKMSALVWVRLSGILDCIKSGANVIVFGL